MAHAFNYRIVQPSFRIRFVVGSAKTASQLGCQRQLLIEYQAQQQAASTGGRDRGNS